MAFSTDGGRNSYLVSAEDPTPSEALLRAVADAADVDPTELPPLYDVIDPDALDELIQRSSAVRTEFLYAGYHVTVTAAGPVAVQEIEAGA